MPERYYSAAALLALLACAFYIATLAPGLMPGDSSDMVAAASTLREAHPPGYPLYSLLGKLFALLPFGEIPYRINLMAAFLGGASVALVFLSLLLLTRHPLASLAGALLCAFNYLFWTYSTLAEVFCLNNFFLALLTFLALRWREKQHTAVDGGRRTPAALAFLAGLSLGNHHTMLLVFPGLLAFVAATDRQILRPARLATLLGWFVLGMLLPYLYLPLAAQRYTEHLWEDTGTLRGMTRLFLRMKYGTFRLTSVQGEPITAGEQALTYLEGLTGQFLWPGFLLGFAGMWMLARRDRAALCYTSGGFLLGLVFLMCANINPKPTAFDAATLERFYQLPNFFFLLWLGVGLAALARAVEQRETGGSGWGKRAFLAALLLGLPIGLLARNLPRNNLRGNHLYPRFIGNIIASLPPNAILLSWTDTVGMGADYLLTVEKRRSDTALLLMGLAGGEPYRSTLRRRYPALSWPASGDKEEFPLGDFLAQNLPRHRVFADRLPRALPFPAVRYGLIYEILPPGARPRARAVLADGERLWRGYDLRQVDTALYPANSMCYSVVVFYYLAQRFNLAAECCQYGDYQAALRHLRGCRAMDGCGYVALSPAWQRQTARAYLGLGQPAQAIPPLRRALQEAPAEPETYALLAQAYRARGDTRRATRYAQEYARRNKQYSVSNFQ